VKDVYVWNEGERDIPHFLLLDRLQQPAADERAASGASSTPLSLNPAARQRQDTKTTRQEKKQKHTAPN
jgi:hypothetical protein